MNWRPNALIICDDLRVEINGKQILIGVYAGDIIFPSFPAKLNQLLFRVEIRGNSEKNEHIIFKVKASDGTQLLEVVGQAPLADPNENSVFIFGLHQPVFDKAERYVVEFGYDGAIEEIGEFKVRTPQSPSEIEKVKTANTA